MPILNSVNQNYQDVAAWRRWMHERPETGFDLHETEAFIAARLEEFGCDEIVRGIGRTGIVAIIRGRLGDGPIIGLRSDMDALPVTELNTGPYISKHPGRMHACGHDGHAAMLLGAARYLSETRNFAGAVALVFQPAEEIGLGAKAMIEDGLIERFGISRFFGMHNMPGIPTGQFAIRSGPIMGSVGKFTLKIKGRGGHAARPHTTIDPVIVCAQIVGALQTLVARETDPITSVVVTVTRVVAGTAYNIIPETAEIWGTVRTLDMADAERVQRRISEICDGIALATGAEIGFEYLQAIATTNNDPVETAFAAQIARDVAGSVDEAVQPVLAGEDFSAMIEARPGALIFIGNGDTAGLHHPAYDFDDEAIPAGVSYWVRLTETALAPR
jgi:amidohydrolase